jgi:FKBP-type peptidyl-prolyl cis-trans isomerase FkpA
MKKKVFIFMFILKKVVFLLFIFLFQDCKTPPTQKPTQNEKNKSVEISLSTGKYILEEDIRFIKNAIKNSFQAYSFKLTKLHFWIESKIKEEEINGFGDKIIYTYEIRDLENNLIYGFNQIGTKTVFLEKENEIRGIEYALKLMKEKEETILLLPSFLAYAGTGDGNKIPSHFPIAIKLKTIKIIKQS